MVAALNPNVNTSTVTSSSSGMGGEEGAVTGSVTSSFDALDMSAQNNFTLHEPGAAFQFTQSIFWTRYDKSNDNTTRHRNKKCHRHNKYIYPISTLVLSLLSPTVSLAQGVGGVSATANPIANSSGSVTNQAIQVLQGPYITNTYGGGVQCQGSTFNLTPYVQYADSRKMALGRLL